ncbi:MAG TPA: hypothetical protein ENK43_16300 [Planctomycetes bacterium]|nr:hypothetical protein [Planctomycetota bacterium]
MRYTWILCLLLVLAGSSTSLLPAQKGQDTQEAAPLHLTFKWPLRKKFKVTVDADFSGGSMVMRTTYRLDKEKKGDRFVLTTEKCKVVKADLGSVKDVSKEDRRQALGMLEALALAVPPVYLNTKGEVVDVGVLDADLIASAVSKLSPSLKKDKQFKKLLKAILSSPQMRESQRAQMLDSMEPWVGYWRYAEGLKPGESAEFESEPAEDDKDFVSDEIKATYVGPAKKRGCVKIVIDSVHRSKDGSGKAATLLKSVFRARPELREKLKLTTVNRHTEGVLRPQTFQPYEIVETTTLVAEFTDGIEPIRTSSKTTTTFKW